MAKFRVKLNPIQHEESRNVRDIDGKVINITEAWTDFDVISPYMEERRKYFIIEEIAAPGKPAAEVTEKPKRKTKGR